MVYWIDPASDPRWVELVGRHESSSIFHTPEWLRALKRTYGFAPLAVTSSPPGSDLADGIPFCRVSSFLTGTRLVSVPFSDHCQPLSAPEEVMQALSETCRRDKLKYVELRPLAAPETPGLAASQRYYYHVLDLRPSLNDILRRFHADCVRRKIRRAERENLTADAGRSEGLIEDFYALQVATRQRLGLPPQPRQWFRYLMEEMGERATIRIARTYGRPIAAILTLRHRKTAVYKYGCSLVGDNNRGGMQLLLWKAIEEAKLQGMEQMDLGRCDIEDKGLAEFKERWGAEKREMSYFRYPARPHQPSRRSTLLAALPKPLLVAAGRLFYRHFA